MPPPPVSPSPESQKPFDNGPVYCIEGFIDDDKSKWGKEINGIEVKDGIGFLTDAAKSDEGKFHAVIAIGEPQTKAAMAKKLDGYVEWENIVHPLAFIASTASMGKGNIVQHFSSVNANSTLGNHCAVNYNVTIGHDCELSDFASVMPQSCVSGFCELKERTYIGAGTILIQNTAVGKDAITGAGSVVLKDVEPNTSVVGCPAKAILERSC
jgi:acetyltransferase EpsM